MLCFVNERELFDCYEANCFSKRLFRSAKELGTESSSPDVEDGSFTCRELAALRGGGLWRWRGREPLGLTAGGGAPVCW